MSADNLTLTKVGWHYLSKATCLIRPPCVFCGITCLVRLIEFAILFTTCQESVCYTSSVGQVVPLRKAAALLLLGEAPMPCFLLRCKRERESRLIGRLRSSLSAQRAPSRCARSVLGHGFTPSRVDRLPGLWPR